MSLEKICNSIAKGRSFILTTHVNPDADGVGSCIALSKLLISLGKEVVIVNPANLPPSFSFLEELASIQTEIPNSSSSADTWVVLDTSRADRTGQIDGRKVDRLTVVIDHHSDNPCYGDVNWVDGKASSTVEMVYKIYQQLGITPELDAAKALYTGLLIDTGGFRFSNTSAFAFSMASDLVKIGVKPHLLYRLTFLDKRPERVLLEGALFSSTELIFNNKVCVMTITEKLLEQIGADNSDLEGLSNNTLAIKGVEIGILFIEMGEKVKVCFRSYQERNVGTLAAIFNGGGHPSASGCTINFPLDEAKRAVLAKVADIPGL